MLAIDAPGNLLCDVAVANPSERRNNIVTNKPIATIVPVELVAYDTSAAVVEPQLTRNKILRKVPHEVRVDELPDFAPDKRPQTAFVIMYFTYLLEMTLTLARRVLRFTKLIQAIRVPVDSLSAICLTVKGAKKWQTRSKSVQPQVSRGCR